MSVRVLKIMRGLLILPRGEEMWIEAEAAQLVQKICLKQGSRELPETEDRQVAAFRRSVALSRRTFSTMSPFTTVALAHAAEDKVAENT
jgi:hypothetical protein